MKSRWCVVTWFVVAAVVAGQGSLTGKWEGKTPNNMTVVLELVAKNAVLTGTLTRNGQSSAIEEGKVSKSSFTFNVLLNGQQESLTGELEGDELRVWMDREGRARTVTLKRAK